MAALGARFDLADAQVAALARYVDLLAGWRRANVTGVRDREAIVATLLGDALALLDVLDDLGAPGGPPGAGHSETRASAMWADLGSGGGIPGIPLAVARPSVELTLIESVGKKCAFLEEAVAAAGLAARAQVVCARSEDAAAHAPQRERFAIVLARAVAPLATVCELAAPLLATGGYLVASTTSVALATEETRGEAAGRACGLAARGCWPLARSPLASSVAAVFEKVTATPDWLPRRPGRARARPLG